MPTPSLPITRLFELVWPNSINAIIWILGCTFLLLVTIRDFVPLLSDYRFDNVASQITIIRDGRVHRPEVTVCIPQYSRSLYNMAKWISSSSANGSNERCEEFEALKQRSSWDVDIRATMSDFSNLSQSEIEIRLANEILEKLLAADPDRFDQYLSFVNDRRSNYNWNQPIIDAASMLLCHLADTDLARVTRIDFAQACDNLTLADDLKISTIPRARIDQLYDYVLEAAYKYLRTYASFDSDDRSPTEHRIRHPQVFVKYKQICFPLLANTSREVFKFEPVDDDEDGGSLPPWRRFERYRQFSVLRDRTILYGTPKKYHYLYRTEKNSLAMINDELSILGYSAVIEVKETRANSRCSMELTPAICLARRRAAVVAKRCRCVPFALRHLLEHEQMSQSDRATTVPTSYCTSSMYDQCGEEALMENFEHDRDECQNKCEHTFLNWLQGTSTRFVDENSKNTMSFAVALDDTRNPFVLFSLAVKDSRQKFIAQMGGVINLYLGISGISVCAFLVFCIDGLIGYCQQRRRKIATNRTIKTDGVIIDLPKLDERQSRRQTGVIRGGNATTMEAMDFERKGRDDGGIDSRRLSAEVIAQKLTIDRMSREIEEIKRMVMEMKGSLESKG